MVNITKNNQYITYEEFKKFSEYFVNKSKQLNYNWEWVEDLNNKNKNGYLKFIQYDEVNKNKFISIDFINDKDDILENIINQQELNEFEYQCEDKGSLNEESDKVKILWEWHIVYSPIFQVPVLFFNAWDIEQKPIDVLSNNDIFPLKPLNMPIITQKDHPILGIPYYYVHPCTTGQNMNLLYNIIDDNDQLEEIDNKEISNANVENSSEKYINYIATWLSTLGFIKVDVNYFL